MKLSTFLLVKSIICIVFGIGFAVIPTAVGSIYEITPDPDGLIMTRFFGAAFIGIGLILWFCRNADWNTLKGIALSLCIADTVGFIAALLGQLSGNVNAVGWVNVALWLVFALGLGYFRFLKPAKT
jgi:hypothetical protein